MRLFRTHRCVPCAFAMAEIEAVQYGSLLRSHSIHHVIGYHPGRRRHAASRLQPRPEFVLHDVVHRVASSTLQLGYHYIQRDYTNGPQPQFMAMLPAELASQVDEAEFARIVGRINRFLADAERNTNDIYLQVVVSKYCIACTYLPFTQNCMACFCGVLFLACVQNPYEKVILHAASRDTHAIAVHAGDGPIHR